MLAARLYGCPATLRAALLCPALYHALSTAGCLLLLPGWQVINQEIHTAGAATAFHAVNAAVFWLLFARAGDISPARAKAE